MQERQTDSRVLEHKLREILCTQEIRRILTGPVFNTGYSHHKSDKKTEENISKYIGFMTLNTTNI